MVNNNGGINKQRRFLYSPTKVKQALKAIDNGMSVLKASKEFRVPRTTLRNKISGKSSLDCPRHCGPESVLGKKNEKLLVEWVLNCAKMGFPIDKGGLLYSVKRIVDDANIKTPFSDNKPGKKWFCSFLSQKHAEYVNKARGSVTKEKIEKWFTEVKDLLTEDGKAALMEPKRVFNMDETCFFLTPKEGLILGPKGQNVYNESTNSDKENVTTLFAVNANGQFAPSLTVYKYERLPASLVSIAPTGWGIGKTESGWMTCASFFEYIANVFLPFLKRESFAFPIVVFVDGHRSHMSLELSRFCRDNKIILVALYPNSTHILQPLDVAVFGPLKKMWQKTVRKWRIDHNGKEISKADVPIILSNLINDPAMPNNVKSGFKSTGLFPFDVNNVDFSKIIIIKPQVMNDTDIEEIKHHLLFLETIIDPDILKQFKDARSKNYDWDGATEAVMLYDVWLKLTNKVETLNIGGHMKDTQDNSEQIPLQQTPPQIINNSVTQGDIMADVEASDNENYDDTLQIIPQQITPEKRVQNNPSHEQFFEADGDENINTPIKPNVQDMYFNPHSNVASTSTSSVIVTPNRSFATVFNDVIPWPHHTPTVGKRKKEYTPSVITSERWIEYYELKEKEKQMKEELKAEKKKKRELQKNNGKKPQVSKRKKKKAPLSSEGEDEEEWIESGDSLDDIDINEVTNQETDDIIFQVEDLKVGDYILALFVSTGKRAIVHYKYVAKILQVLEGDDFEVQCLKSLDETKTTFKFIENDQCVIAKKEILGRLPDPQLVQFGRILKTVFPAAVEVYEKS